MRLFKVIFATFFMHNDITYDVWFDSYDMYTAVHMIANTESRIFLCYWMLEATERLNVKETKSIFYRIFLLTIKIGKTIFISWDA